MDDQVTTVLLASNLLRSPHLFDGLGPPAIKGEGEKRAGRRKEGAATGGLCRDLVLYAALNKKRQVELSIPDFCKEMGYDSSNLMRKCTDEQVEEIRRKNWPEHHIPAFSNMLGLALVRLVSHNFIFPDRGEDSKHERIAGSKIVDHIDLFKPQKSGTLLTFTLSEEVLEQNRKVYQSLSKEEYLSLRTQSTTRKAGHPGHPDDAARRMYMRLRWKRGYWDWLLKEGRYEDAKNFAKDSYRELVQVAGLNERDYWPPKRVASELRKLLNRIGGMGSIKLVPTVVLELGKYVVTWKHEPFTLAGQKRPAKQEQPSKQARPPRTKSKPSPSAKPQPAQPAPVKATRPAPRHKEKLKNELEDLTKRLRWMESDEASSTVYAEKPELLKEHQGQALARLEVLQNELAAV